MDAAYERFWMFPMGCESNKTLFLSFVHRHPNTLRYTRGVLTVTPEVVINTDRFPVHGEDYEDGLDGFPYRVRLIEDENGETCVRVVWTDDTIELKGSPVPMQHVDLQTDDGLRSYDHTEEIGTVTGQWTCLMHAFELEDDAHWWADHKMQWSFIDDFNPMA